MRRLARDLLPVELVSEPRIGAGALRLETRWPVDVDPTPAETTTPQTTASKDSVVPAPPPPKYELPARLRGDDLLRRRPEPTGLFVPGLGPLPADDPLELGVQITRAVRGQGVEAVRRHITDLRSTAEALHLRAKAIGGGASLARAAQMLRLADQAAAVLAGHEAERAVVEEKLAPYLEREAGRMLAASRARVRALRAQYFDEAGAPKQDELRGLRAASKRLYSRLVDVRRAERLPDGRERDVRLDQAQRRFEEVYTEVSSAHPLLASFGLSSPRHDDLRDLATDRLHIHRTSPARPRDEPVRSLLDRTEAAGERMQEKLQDDPTLVWRLPNLVQATLVREGVNPRSMIAAHARDLVRQANEDDAAWRQAVSFVAMGLGVVASVPTGGASLALTASAAAAVDGYQLFLAIEAYALQDTAAHTALNPHDALVVEAPAVGGLVLDAAAAFGSALGASFGLRALRARPDPVGDMARRLEDSLGTTRAERLLDGLGDEAKLFEAFHGTDPQVWSALSRVDPAQVQASARALGPEMWSEWSAKLGAEVFAELVGRTPPAAWPHLLATPIDPMQARQIVQTLAPEVVEALAPHLKGLGLLSLARQPGAHTIELAGVPYVKLDGAWRMQAFGLANASPEKLIAARAEWAQLKAKLGPLGPRIQQISGPDTKQLAKLAEARRKGKPTTGKQLTDIAERLGVERAEAQRIIDDVAGLPAPKLSARARALVDRAPDLRYVLELLEAKKVPAGLHDRTLRALEGALDETRATIEGTHLRRWLDGIVGGKGDAARELSDRLHELEYALRVVDEGRVMPGSTVYLGVGPGTRAELTPGGPVVELTDAPGMANGLYDIDVLYLSRDNEVVAAEVQRTANALWYKIDGSKDGMYLSKWARFKAAGAEAEQVRHVELVFAEGDDVALDRPLRRFTGTPRGRLSADFELRWRKTGGSP